MGSLLSLISNLKQIGFGALLGCGLLVISKGLFPDSPLGETEINHLAFMGAATGAGIQLFFESTILGKLVVTTANLCCFVCYCAFLKFIVDEDTVRRLKARGLEAILPRLGNPLPGREEIVDLLNETINELSLHEKRVRNSEQEVVALQKRINELSLYGQRIGSLEQQVLLLQEQLQALNKTIGCLLEPNTSSETASPIPNGEMHARTLVAEEQSLLPDVKEGE